MEKYGGWERVIKLLEKVSFELFFMTTLIFYLMDVKQERNSFSVRSEIANYIMML